MLCPQKTTPTAGSPWTIFLYTNNHLHRFASPCKHSPRSLVLTHRNRFVIPSQRSLCVSTVHTQAFLSTNTRESNPPCHPKEFTQTGRQTKASRRAPKSSASIDVNTAVQLVHKGDRPLRQLPERLAAAALVEASDPLATTEEPPFTITEEPIGAAIDPIDVAPVSALDPLAATEPPAPLPS